MADPTGTPRSYLIFINLMSNRRTWVCLFIAVYAILLSSSWNLLKSVLNWYKLQYTSPSPSRLPAVYASVMLGTLFGAISMVAATAVVVPAVMVIWITVVLLLAFFGKPRRVLVIEGRKITRDVVGFVFKVLLKEGFHFPELAWSFRVYSLAMVLEASATEKSIEGDSSKSEEATEPMEVSYLKKRKAEFYPEEEEGMDDDKKEEISYVKTKSDRLREAEKVLLEPPEWDVDSFDGEEYYSSSDPEIFSDDDEYPDMEKAREHYRIHKRQLIESKGFSWSQGLGQFIIQTNLPSELAFG